MAKTCLNCGATNESEFIFCYQCGRKLAAPSETTPESGGEVLSCPGCGILNPANYKFCGSCGFNLSAPTAAITEAPAEEVPSSEEEEVKPSGEKAHIAEEQGSAAEEREIKTCPNCGEQNPSNYLFCGICGFNLTAPAEAVPEIPAKEVTPPERGKPVEKEIQATEKEPTTIEDVFIVEEKVTTTTRISTGIEGLDTLINGGFLKNKVYLVSGGPGTGQTIFGLQYLYYGLESGENGLYYSGDEKPEQLVLDAKSLGWDLSRYIKEKRLGLVDSSHYFSDLYAGKSKSIDSRTIIRDLSKRMKKLNARRLVIDPVTPLLTGEEHYTNIQEYLRNLILTLEDSLECTTLITSGNQANVIHFSRYGIEEMVTGGIIILSMDKRKSNGERARTLFIPKMRGTPTDLKEHTFEIQQGKGIVVLD